MQHSQEETLQQQELLSTTKKQRFSSTTIWSTAANPATYLPSVVHIPGIDINPHLRYQHTPPKNIPLTTWERGAIVYQHIRDVVTGAKSLVHDVYLRMILSTTQRSTPAQPTTNHEPTSQNSTPETPSFLEERLQDA